MLQRIKSQETLVVDNSFIAYSLTHERDTLLYDAFNGRKMGPERGSLWRHWAQGKYWAMWGGHTAQNRNQSNNKWEMTSRDIVQI